MNMTTTQGTKMRALVQDAYGSTDVLRLEDVAVPEITAEQVLIRVQAASINPLDWHVMRASPAFIRLMGGIRRPKQPIRGVDVAGIVEAVGSSITGFEPGDHVVGTAPGSLAEYAAASHDKIVRIPDDVDFEAAASVPVAGITALQGLRDLGQIEPGQKVLIIGASGGVGTFAVQLAKHFGAEVTGVCSSRNADLVRSIGADHVIDYSSTDILDSAERYDVIFQLAGTTSPLKLRRILAETGTLVLSSGMGRMSGIDRIVKAMALRPFVEQRLMTWVANENGTDMRFLADLLESGAITPVIDRIYPLAEAAEALRYVEEGHTQGKVVVTVP
jgi:NADPH:quinone reductase-like Zn-dependent oxidoreductase